MISINMHFSQGQLYHSEPYTETEKLYFFRLLQVLLHWFLQPLVKDQDLLFYLSDHKCFRNKDSLTMHWKINKPTYMVK